MTEQLGRRCAFVLLVALTLALAVGMLAWGPVTIDVATHQYADRRAWLGLAHAVNVLVNVPVALIGLWGYRVTSRSGWPDELRVPWQAFHLCVVGGSVLAALYHLDPGPTGYVLAQFAMTAGFVLLALGALAERVGRRLGSRAGRRAAAVLLLAALGGVLGATVGGGPVDLRPFIALQVLPVLLVPAGAVSLPGSHTRTLDWLVMLALYAAAKAVDLGDASILRWTGWISGHALMHLSLGGVAAWLAYCAIRARGDSAPAVPSRRKASLTIAS